MWSQRLALLFYRDLVGSEPGPTHAMLEWLGGEEAVNTAQECE
jgi:hypothetical protein